MRQSFIRFYKNSVKNLIEALFNIFVFLPYFFSVITLSRTLFFPWKNLVTKKTTAGFSFDEWLNRSAFNFISRIIGFSMRLSILVFYFFFQTLLIILIPIGGIIYLILTPIFYIDTFFQIPEEKRKKIYKDHFLSTHLLQEDNRAAVESWFEIYHRQRYFKNPWWKLNNLFSLPPLARDWAMGFTPILNQYAIDMTSVAYQGKTKNMLDRQKEIDEMERILSKTIESNVVIVGDEGVGKHTIADALTKKIYEGKTNTQLMYKRVLKLNMEKILVRENLFEELLAEAAESKSVILMIENLDKYVALATIIEKYAKNNLVQIIGLTTPFAYQKFIVPNDKICRTFTKVDVYEVSESQAEEILLDNCFVYEQRYKIIIPYETIKAAVSKSNYYITYIPYPEKALELLDSACVYVKKGVVMPGDIDAVLTEKTHIPAALTSQIKEKLIHLESLLSARIFQQKEAICKLSSTLRRSFILLGLRKKPLATFLFLGPTGVGKTATAKILAEIFFGSSSDHSEGSEESRLLRFDMSLYQSKQDIPKLIGSMESGNPGLLTMAVRKQPYGVLLLDEIEKADHDLINIFLTILDEGYFTDGYGKKVDCKNLVIIATSNAKNIEKSFSPEFLNRFDGVIVYQTLSTVTAIDIARAFVKKIEEDIYKLHKVKVSISDNYLQELVNKGYDAKFGARNMERVIRDNIEDKIAKLLLSNEVKQGGSIQI